MSAVNIEDGGLGFGIDGPQGQKLAVVDGHFFRLAVGQQLHLIDGVVGAEHAVKMGAQSGLPVAYGSGTRLNRITNNTKEDSCHER